MLTIYKTAEQGHEQLDSMANGTWVKAVDPTPEELQKLVAWEIDVDYINYSLDLDEMPRMERDEDYTFILIRIPHRQPESDIPYATIPLGIMIKGNTIVTICRYEKEMFKVLANGKYRLLKTGKRYRFALYIFLETATRYLTHLREINRMTEAIEDQLQKSTRNRELLEDVLTENQQAIQMTNINTEILSSMMDAFASIISNNLNGVMKALAAITIIINVPAVVAAFYGMNVALPGETHPLAFLVVIGISLSLTALAIFIFYKRDWFENKPPTC